MGILSSLHGALFGYHFVDHQQPLAEQVAQRATLSLFQTYPSNSVNGMATLSYRNRYRVQPVPQVFVSHQQILEDISGGGTFAGTLYDLPLVPNNPGQNGTGMS